MSLTLVVAAAAEPLSLAEARAHCRVDHVGDDALLSSYILAARELAEAYTKRAFLPQTWEMKIDGRWPVFWNGREMGWCCGIELPRPPFQSVTSITYIDSLGVLRTLDTNQYQAMATNGESREGLVVPAYGVTWPEVRDQPQSITVRFVAGYADTSSVPQRVRQALRLLVNQWYESREPVAAGSTSELPFTVAALLDPLRVPH